MQVPRFYDKREALLGQDPVKIKGQLRNFYERKQKSYEQVIRGLREFFS